MDSSDEPMSYEGNAIAPAPSAQFIQGGQRPATNTRITSSKSRVGSRNSGRSRQGCCTCRKRKVKCNEVRPVCGHCHRLQLACAYDSGPAERSAASSKARRHRQISPLSQQKEPDLQSAARLSTAEAHGPFDEERGLVNSSRVQSVSYEPSPLPDYDPSLMGSIIPNLSFDLPVSQPTQQQRYLGPDSWELELLGEDSLWATIPMLSDFISAPDPSSYEYLSSSYGIQQPPMNKKPQNNGQLPVSVPSNGAGIEVAPHVMQSTSDPNPFIPADEITLLRHFVDFAVPPILIGVEPRWNNSRDALLRLSKSHLPLRHAICAFSALSFGGDPGAKVSTAGQSSSFYSDLAMKELKKLLGEQSSDPPQLDSPESILASIFFLSYVELIVSNTPKSSLELLDRAHILLSNKAPSSSTLYDQLQIWLKLLDAKAVSAGGKGIHLHTNPDTLDLDVIRDSYDSLNRGGESGNSSTIILETEEILFNSLNRQAYNFYLQVLNFSGRIARLDRWHRSRGSVQDELEVMLAADKILRDLNALWTRRPAIIDLADETNQLRQQISPSLATKIEHHLRTYASNFHACFIHLQRVAYAQLQAISQVKPAVAKIVHLSRKTLEDGHGLPVSMLWPLMMAACEAREEETQNWIIGCIEGMKSKVGNATRTAKLVREIIKRQKNGQRADARAVMHEAFGEVFAII